MVKRCFLSFIVVLCGLFAGCASELASEGSSGIVGVWELTTVSDWGTRTRNLTINDDLSGIYQGRDSEFPISDLKVEGSDVTFNVTMKYREREFTMEFKGVLDGETLNGEWVTSRGNREVTGKKAASGE